MNIQSVILLGIILAAFFLVGYRHLMRNKGHRSCGGCDKCREG